MEYCQTLPILSEKTNKSVFFCTDTSLSFCSDSLFMYISNGTAASRFLRISIKASYVSDPIWTSIRCKFIRYNFLAARTIFVKPTASKIAHSPTTKSVNSFKCSQIRSHWEISNFKSFNRYNIFILPKLDIASTS